jgi:Nucleotide-sugar transporter
MTTESSLLGSTADLWVRNVQLSSWSIIPALIPVLVGFLRDGTTFGDVFANFGSWAWCTVLMQVFGGLVTALVIKVRLLEYLANTLLSANQTVLRQYSEGLCDLSFHRPIVSRLSTAFQSTNHHIFSCWR